MTDIRKIIIIFVIAILFSVLVFSVIEAVHPSPEYEDYCKNNYPRAVKIEQDCDDIVTEPCEKGYVEYTYDETGCPVSYECNTCQEDYNAANDEHRQYVFYISAVLALIAIFVGMYLPASKNSLNEWIGTGFMLGGAFTLLFGTAFSFSSLDRIVRPIVIFLELILVIFVAYRKIGNLKKDKK